MIICFKDAIWKLRDLTVYGPVELLVKDILKIELNKLNLYCVREQEESGEGKAGTEW